MQEAPRLGNIHVCMTETVMKTGTNTQVPMTICDYGLILVP